LTTSFPKSAAKSARPLLACVPLVGLLGGAAIVFATPTAVAQPAPVNVSLSWADYLNDAPCGVALASPTEFSDSGVPAVEVGDREGDRYAVALQNGAPLPGWTSSTNSPGIGNGQGCEDSNTSGGVPKTASGVNFLLNGTSVPGSPPIDSTASVDPNNGSLYFGAGNAAVPGLGGYYAYTANGTFAWNQVVTNPATDSVNDVGVQASLAIGGDGSILEGGSLGQMTYALNTANGTPATGWPQFSADSVFSTAAVGDLYGTGTDDFVSGGASSQGFALGKNYSDGGQLRIFNDHGGLVCHATTTEQIESSPAIGPILPGGAYGIATGTGSFWGLTKGPQSDDDTVKVFNTNCDQVWSTTLNGFTGGSPALADVEGNGQLAVVEGTQGGTVYALNAANGSVLWQKNVIGAVYGSVTTANFGQGYQDVIVPTTLGIEILDGQTGDEVAQFDDGSTNGGVTTGGPYGFQNAPLVTADPDGKIGITVAGYFAICSAPCSDVQGIVQHFEVSSSSGSQVNAAGSWPQFHHDAQLTGFVGGGGTPGTCNRPAAALSGYLTVASDGGIFAFGQDFCGSTGSIALNKPVVGMAMTPTQGGYWLVASDGGVFSYGAAQFYGSTGSLALNKPVVGMAATPDGRGYWLVASDGGIFSFGDAQFYGSAASVPNQTIVGMAASPDGQGYWEVSTTGRVFPFGDAVFSGDTVGLHLNGFIVGMAGDPVTGGYWLVGSDGGVFSFGAPFFGSTGGIVLNRPVVAMQATGDGGGYWFVASDGGIFAYGDAPFRGSMGGKPLNRAMVGMYGF
jgi:outer membrane protein assembly factor BamB